MKIIHTTALTPKQLAQMQSLVSLCRRVEGLSLSCPLDADDFWLMEGEPEMETCGTETVAGGTETTGARGTIARETETTGARGTITGKPGPLHACFAVYRMEEDLWECSAFTAPDIRKRGCFTTLLEQVVSYGEAFGEPCLCFVTDNRCPAALKALSRLGAELSRCEHMMACNISDTPIPAPEPDALRLAPESLKSPLPEEFTITAYLAWPASQNPAPPAGSCRVCAFGNQAYLYSLEIAPEFRRQGLGTEFLLKTMKLLGNAGCAALRLQVSGDNIPALGLYKKTGFRISETLSYYLY